MRTLERFLALVLTLALAGPACAPRASGPPRPGGEGTRLESGAFTSPEPPARSPQVLPVDSENPDRPHAVTRTNPGEAPEELTGTVVEVRGDELFLQRPSGVELRFLLPQDVRIEPQGRTRADLVRGARVRVQVRHLERGMGVARLILQGGAGRP